MYDFLDKFTNVIEKEGKEISSDDIRSSVALLKSNLLKIIPDCEDARIYIDIKDRYLFINLFFSLLSLKSKIVLLPIEIKNEDYYFDNMLYISDNKKTDFGIFIDSDLNLYLGSNFSCNFVKEQNDNFFYLYTSGSTGKARLIPKSYKNILTELKELKNALQVSSEDVFYFTPPLYHIYGVLFGLFLPFYCSARLIIDYHFTPDTISAFVDSRKISFFISIPSYYKMFDDLNLIEDFKNTKKLINSSAPLSFEVSKRFYDKGIEITEIYGSTETGGIASRIAPKNIEWNLFSYIKVSGKESVIENIDNKKLTELIIESEAISDVYDKKLGYNTGDVVEFYDNGKFALAGRNTRFVKISGKRVDLKYVENKFKEYVLEETGRSISDDLLYAGEKNEKIYIFYEFDFLKSVNDIKNDLKKHLPGYAIPRRYFSQKIPRNEMGKINKLKIEEIVKNI